MFSLKESFEEISSKFGEPKCYWDFPSCGIAFAESLKNSSLFIVEAETGFVFFRKGKTALKLITFFCSEEDMLNIIRVLKQNKFSIKSLPFSGKGITNTEILIKAKIEYFTDKNWNIDLIKKQCTKNERKQINHAFNRCSNKYYEDEFSLKDAKRLIETWLKEAKDRHFMVRKGHHIKYIENYFRNRNNVTMFGLRRKEDGLLFGISGFELFRGSVQFTIFKHLLGDHPFPKYMRILALEKAVNMIDDNGFIYSGSSSDKAKQSLGLKQMKTYKLDCKII